MATCPECEYDEIDTEDLEEGDSLNCPECGKSLVVSGAGDLESDDDDEDDDDEDEDFDEEGGDDGIEDDEDGLDDEDELDEEDE